MHHEFVATPSDAVAQLMERTMDESAPPPGINKSYHPQRSEALSSNADDFMDVDIGTDADEFVGWKGRVRSDLDSLSNGDDASAGGLGGCPYAPGAAGNVATEDLVYLFDQMGVATGVDLDALVDASCVIEQALGTPLPSRVLRARLAERERARH